MPEPICVFDYAFIRLVLRVECEYFLNVGLVLHCPEQQFLQARTHWDVACVRALWPDLTFDEDLLLAHLEAFGRIAKPDHTAGPIALLSRRERFHWLTAPRSTVIQLSPVHSGLCSDSRAEFERLWLRAAVTGTKK